MRTYKTDRFLNGIIDKKVEQKKLNKPSKLQRRAMRGIMRAVLRKERLQQIAGKAKNPPSRKPRKRKAVFS